jgi:hypothetical protein
VKADIGDISFLKMFLAKVGCGTAAQYKIAHETLLVKRRILIHPAILSYPGSAAGTTYRFIFGFYKKEKGSRAPLYALYSLAKRLSES